MRKFLVICSTIVMAYAITLVAIPNTTVDEVIAHQVITGCVGVWGYCLGKKD